MKRSSIVNSVATLAAVAIWCSMGAPAVAQSKKLPPGAVNDKKVQVGYGLDKDQPFAGADPDGTGLPFKEPPPAAVEAAKKTPTPHLADGHPDLTGFWGPAGWGFSATPGKLSAGGQHTFTHRPEAAPEQQAEKTAAVNR